MEQNLKLKDFLSLQQIETLQCLADEELSEAVYEKAKRIILLMAYQTLQKRAEEFFELQTQSVWDYQMTPECMEKWKSAISAIDDALNADLRKIQNAD